jgi:hypothetical protein
VRSGLWPYWQPARTPPSADCTTWENSNAPSPLCPLPCTGNARVRRPSYCVRAGRVRQTPTTMALPAPLLPQRPPRFDVRYARFSPVYSSSNGLFCFGHGAPDAPRALRSACLCSLAQDPSLSKWPSPPTHLRAGPSVGARIFAMTGEQACVRPA